MASLVVMELDIRGKNIFGNSKNVSEMISCLHDMETMLRDIPPEATLTFNQDDYLTFSVEAKDKDDVKYYSRGSCRYYRYEK